MENIYYMINRENGAKIKCTKDYLPEWIARGFEVEEIKIETLFPKEEE